MLFIGASSEFGDVDRVDLSGDGVDTGKPLFEYCLSSESCCPP